MSKRILYVDDEPDWRLIPGTILREAGFEVLTAASVSDTKFQTERIKLDLIILDVNLGRESASDLLQVLKVRHPEAPIMLYTGLVPDDPSVQTMIKAGAQHYLRKGTMKELVDSVQSALAV